MIGIDRRMKRLLKGPARRCLLIALDHGPWLGPVPGLDRPREIVCKVVAGGATAMLVTPGFLGQVASVTDPGMAIVLRVSLSAGLSSEAVQEVPAFTATTALRLDADAVAVSIFFGRGGEVSMMHWLGELIEQSHGLGMPVVAEMMPPEASFYDPDAIAHAARIGMELGADIVKTNYCGNMEAFRQVVSAVPVPILVAGGPTDGGDAGALRIAREAVEAGAAGVAFGRRVWQAKDPETLVREVRDVIMAVESPAKDLAYSGVNHGKNS
jgi:fructose-bisphosphate aldolase/2-amino-3,7-dideoxy-D-threo-hept-6-ulosonate synthase